MPIPVLAHAKTAFARVQTDDVFDLLFDAVGFGGRQINFVENRNQFEIVFDREICVGESLRFNALRCVND